MSELKRKYFMQLNSTLKTASNEIFDNVASSITRFIFETAYYAYIHTATFTVDFKLDNNKNLKLNENIVSSVR